MTHFNFFPVTKTVWKKKILASVTKKFA